MDPHYKTFLGPWSIAVALLKNFAASRPVRATFQSVDPESGFQIPDNTIKTTDEQDELNGTMWDVDVVEES